MNREQIDNLRRLAPKLRENLEFQEAVIAAIETIHRHDIEELIMARTFAQAAQILVDANNAKTATIEDLKAKLAAAAPDPATVAAEQIVIDAAEKESPEAPAPAPVA